MRIRRNLLVLAAIGLVASTLTACGSDSGGDNGATGDKKITIGIKFDQPGLGMQDGSTYTGFDVDVARYVAKKLGYEESQITWVEAPSAQRENLLANGQADMIFATYSITDERKKKVDFGGPYFVAAQDLLVPNGSTITGPDDLDGKKLCSVTGSTPAQRIKDEYSKGVQLQEYDTYSKCVEALASGAIDAVTTDDIILAGYASQPAYKGKMKVVGNPFSSERYGIGLPKGSTECQKVNDAVKAMIDDGTWQQLLDKNLGDSGYKPDSKQNPPTTFEACTTAS